MRCTDVGMTSIFGSRTKCCRSKYDTFLHSLDLAAAGVIPAPPLSKYRDRRLQRRVALRR